MPSSTNAYVLSFSSDSDEAKRTIYCLQGLVNQTKAEVFVPTRPYDMEHLTNSRKPFVRLSQVGGANSGLRTLFQRYSGRVQKMYLYDPAKDWTFFLALMASAQNSGIPVTASIRTQLVAQVPGWSGTVVDYRTKGTDRASGYRWAITNLMPGCTKKVTFVIRSLDRPVFDYAVATKGFIAYLNLSDSTELAVQRSIFATSGFGPRSVMMGYNYDSANEVANAYGIGYVPSDYYSNGSFWSSFANRTFTQTRGSAITAQNGKVYVSLVWSDGDNIQFDQRDTYQLWKGAARGVVPVATSLSPVLQELDPCLLARYYALKSSKDELVAGPSGWTFMFLDDFKTDNNALLDWCRLNRTWCADAGFHSASLWRATLTSARFTTYVTNCGLDSILMPAITTPQVNRGVVLVKEGGNNWVPNALYDALSSVAANANAPVFTSQKMIVQGFSTNGGYAAVTNVVGRLNRTYPGKYVFISHGSMAATIKARQ
jgi:hypothetical protein